MRAETKDRLAPADEALVRDLVRHTFGSRAELAAYRVVNQRHDYAVLLATLRQPRLRIVLKLAGPAAPHVYSFERVAMLHRLVTARTTVMLPQVIAVDVSYATWPWRVLIQTEVAGQEWATVRQQLAPHEREATYAQLGSAVAQIHSITFPAFGELLNDGMVRPEKPVVALQTRAQHMIGDPRLRELFLQVVAERAALFADVTPARLCHDDLHHHNILFRYEQGRWRLAAVLDFDKAWAGFAESDLARLELWQGMTGPGFWPAYYAEHDLPGVYQERRPVFQLLWCFEYAAATARHHADTQAVCVQLGIETVHFG